MSAVLENAAILPDTGDVGANNTEKDDDVEEHHSPVGNGSTPTKSSAPSPAVTPEAAEDPMDYRPEPETTVSLDQEEEVSDLEEKSPNEQTMETEEISVRAEPNEEDDSSDDQSSYFNDPNHLPKPKSSRRYSWSSNASQNLNMSRESDASLSFSDESDEEHHHMRHTLQPPMAQQPFYAVSAPPPPGMPELSYPAQISRMHSVSSLVSTSSQNSTASDELEDVGVEPKQRSASREGHTVRSRTGASNPVSFTSPTNVNIGPSPPTIMSNYPNPNIIPHPQPHSMTQEQLAAWTAAGRYGGLGDSRNALPSYSSKESDLAYSGESDHPLDHAKRSEIGSPLIGNPLIGNPEPNRVWSSQKDRNISHDSHPDDKGFKVYWQRWLMLLYMSLLNLLSDWTCYSVAPIALLTEEAFGRINPEQLVVVFLCANGVATACEPMILSRLGLRRTVIVGALFLMIGSIIKSGGMPPIIQANLTKGEGEWRVYLGFFLVGLSQPLYQCTPALLSASWFPEAERTMATGVALNANQLGIGFAFIFGTLLVADSDDIPKYFGLLSLISTLTFLGALFQFDDAPPTPPSDTARVMRGTLEVKLPSVQTIFDSVRNYASESPLMGGNRKKPKDPPKSSGKKSSSKSKGGKSSRKSRKISSESNRASGQGGSTTRRRTTKSAVDSNQGIAQSPSPARWGRVGDKPSQYGSVDALIYAAPSPAPMGAQRTARPTEESDGGDETGSEPRQEYAPHPYPIGGFPGAVPGLVFGPGEHGGSYAMPPPGYAPQPQFGGPYWDPRMHPPPFAYPPQYPQFPGYPPIQHDPYYNYYSYQQNFPPPPHTRGYEDPQAVLPAAAAIDEGVEPVLTMTPHHMDINIRDDQVLLSIRACIRRAGFIHSLVSFTVSGIVINTLSTFMDYLVRLNGAGREYTGIVGGSFQFGIMISSLIIGKVCDKTRAYYSIAIAMLVLGAFGLAECGVSLDADRGSSLRWSLIVVALLVGPLQPVSTELGVDVVYPLSENTVLVIQQLFSNLLSAAFIPCFKAMKDIGAVALDDGATEKPQYTFSFYLLILLHAAATVFFATFNGRYLRFEHEEEKKAKEERRRNAAAARAFHRIIPDHLSGGGSEDNLSAPFIPPVV